MYFWSIERCVRGNSISLNLRADFMETDTAQFRKWHRWFNPGQFIGNAYMTASMKVSLAGWQPRQPFDRRLKDVIRLVAPRFTMVPLKGLRTLADHVRRIHDHAIPGCVVECGTWRGGGLALMERMSDQLGDDRKFWGFDSFEGLPQPGEHDPQAAHDAYVPNWCAATELDVRDAFDAAGGNRERLTTVKGWLDETLPGSLTGPIALLNIDVDWYSSVMTTLVELYDRVTPGGVINFDDYGYWSGCDSAVHDFMKHKGLDDLLLQRTEPKGAWLQKPVESDAESSVSRTSEK